MTGWPTRTAYVVKALREGTNEKPVWRVVGRLMYPVRSLRRVWLTVGLLAIAMLLVTGCVPTYKTPSNWAAYPYYPPLYRVQPALPPPVHYNLPQDPPPEFKGPGEPKVPPSGGEAAPSTKPAQREDTIGWWRMGGILWPRWQEPIQ
jgi:hypothetical protein